MHLQREEKGQSNNSQCNLYALVLSTKHCLFLLRSFTILHKYFNSASQPANFLVTSPTVDDSMTVSGWRCRSMNAYLIQRKLKMFAIADKDYHYKESCQFTEKSDVHTVVFMVLNVGFIDCTTDNALHNRMSHDLHACP